jgi:hypothetical protein
LETEWIKCTDQPHPLNNDEVLVIVNTAMDTALYDKRNDMWEMDEYSVRGDSGEVTHWRQIDKPKFIECDNKKCASRRGMICHDSIVNKSGIGSCENWLTNY